MLPLCRENPGSEYGFPVVDEDFDGTAVHEHPEMEQAVFQHAGADRVPFLPERNIHSAAIQDNLTGCFAEAECETALSVSARKTSFCAGSRSHGRYRAE